MEWDRAGLLGKQLLIKQPLLVPVWKTEEGPLELCDSQGFCRMGGIASCHLPVVTPDGGGSTATLFGCQDNERAQ